ncbi:MAG: hypothetical protein IGS39_01725 [Calothrix sp. C42_A2020_038]|nr:hypothetical protein [Calothrix sp. C42_A2020_038]
MFPTSKLAKLLPEIRQLNPILQAKLREQMHTEIYLKLLAEKKLNEPSIMTKIVVTKRAIESYFELHNFTEQLIGRPLLSNQVKKEVLLGIQKQFHQIPLDNKIKLAESESNWLNLQQVWSNASQEYKLQKVTQLREIVKNPKFSETWTLLNITLKSQVYSGSQNRFLPLYTYPYDIPGFDPFICSHVKKKGTFVKAPF